MNSTRDGRPFCEVRDPAGHGPVVRVHPVIYDVLRRVVEGRMTCCVDLNFNDGTLGNSHVKVSGDKFVAPIRPDSLPGATLQEHGVITPSAQACRRP
jgi:hypothetical protein